MPKPFAKRSDTPGAGICRGVLGRALLNAALLGLVACDAGDGSAVAVERAWTPVAEEDFESAPEWGVFEELVNGNACYTDGVASVTPSADAAHTGSLGLAVTANAAGSVFSNHVLGQWQLAQQGQSGEWRLTVWARIPDGADGDGQTGPEFSMQNTRLLGEGYRTFIAGVQYVSSPFADPVGGWNLWTDSGDGEAGWVALDAAPLEAGDWVRLELSVDFDARRYTRLRVDGAGVQQSWNLSDTPIVAETKFSEATFWITLEAENLWTACSEATRFPVHYDDLVLERR